MKKKKCIFSGVFSLIISQCIVKIFGLVYKLYLANKQGFGDGGNAIYNSGYQIYALLLTISSIGVPNAVSKLIAEKYYRGDKIEILKILKSALVVFSVIGIIFSIGLALSADLISDKLLDIKEAKYSIIALSPAILNVCLISVYRGLYNGIRNVNVTAKSQTIEQILKTIFTIVLVELSFYITCSNTVIMAATANFATTLATLFSLIYLCRKNNVGATKVKCETKYAKRILKISIPISLSAILASFNKNIDSITVVRFLKDVIGEQNAIIQYGILSGKIDVLATLPVSFVIAAATTVLPSISMFNAQKNHHKIKEILNTYILFTVLLVLPCSIGMVFFSNQILDLLFSNTAGSFLLKISAISVLFISLEQIINAALQGIGKVLIPTIALTIGVITKIILNITLIRIPENIFPLGGVSGACVATLVCHVVACTIGWKVLRRKIKLNLSFFKYILKPIISSCIMLVSLNYSYFLLKGIITQNIAIILAIIIAGIVYVSSVLMLRILSKDELKMIPILSNFIKK